MYGHHHSYQRTCLVANEVCLGVSSRAPTNNEEYRAPVHVILGTAGMGLVSESRRIYLPRDGRFGANPVTKKDKLE